MADKNAAAHGGVWLKESAGSYELRGKTLGIIGYGNIGSPGSVMAEDLGPPVLYFDGRPQAAAGSDELRGKALGIIGYGNIGSQVSVMAEALGLHVIYYDVVTKLPHGNAKQIRDLNEFLQQSNIV